MAEESIISRRQDLRDRLIASRKVITQGYPDRVDQMRQRLQQWLHTQTVQCVGIYRAFRGEPDIEMTMRQWADNAPHRQIAMPVIDDPYQGVMHYGLISQDVPLSVGQFGIAEPRSGSVVIPDLILIPCVGISSLGYRLGYGGGFFDRYLQKMRVDRNIMALGIAFDALITADFHPESWDQPLDYFVTESVFCTVKKCTSEGRVQ